MRLRQLRYPMQRSIVWRRYLAYVVVGVEASGPGGGSLYTVGANCPECNGVGKVGDGVTMLTCAWDDGLVLLQQRQDRQEV